jgi:hypothetical protein
MTELCSPLTEGSACDLVTFLYTTRHPKVNIRKNIKVTAHQNNDLVLIITQAPAVQVSGSFVKNKKLRQFFISVLQDNPSMLLQTAFFQQEGAVPHFARRVKLFMNGACPE